MLLEIQRSRLNQQSQLWRGLPRHGDEGPRLPLPIATHAFKQVVTVLAIARHVCVGAAGIVGNGGAIHLNVGAICVCPVNIPASGLGVCARLPGQGNAAISPY